MSDIFREVEEDIRRDRFERLARRYGPGIIALVITLIIATAGYVAWQGWIHRQQAAATNAFVLAVEKEGGAGGVKAAAEALASFSQTLSPASVPAILARLYEAGLRAQIPPAEPPAGSTPGPTPPAATTEIYEQIAHDGKADRLYRDLAVVLDTLRQVDTGAPEPLLARLQPLTDANNPWHHTALELTALLAARTGDRAKARLLYRQLADDATAPAGLRARAGELAAFYGKS